MIQTQGTSSQDRQPDPGQNEFPPAAADTANPLTGIAAVSLPHSEAPRALQMRAEAAFITLDKLDLLSKNGTGEPAITCLLQEFGTNKAEACDAFIARQRNAGESALEVIHELTGLPEDLILCHYPGAERAQSHEELSMGTKQLLTAIYLSDGSSLTPRELVIETVTRTTMQNQDSYETHKSEVTEKYEQLFNQMCSPNTSDLVLFPLKEAWNAFARAAKSVGVFLFRSLVTQNLPAFIKANLKIENSRSSQDEATFLTSMLASSLMTASVVAAFMVPRLPPTALDSSHSARIFALGALSFLTGAGIEVIGRLSLSTMHTFPGSILLELASLPVQFGIKVFHSISAKTPRWGDRIREQKSLNLKGKGY